MISNSLQRRIIKLAGRNLNKVTCKYRHFTFIARRNTIVSFGHNKIFHSHPVSKKFSYRYSDIHSELAAILDFPYPIKKLQNYDIINIRVRRDNGGLGLARPCKKCIFMLKSLFIEQVYYSNEFGNWSCERFV